MSINMTTPKDWDRVTHKATQQDWERANSPTPDHALNRYSFPGRDSELTVTLSDRRRHRVY